MRTDDAPDAFESRVLERRARVSAHSIRLFLTGTLFALAASFACLGVWFWTAYYRMNIISIEPNAEDNGPEHTLCYFPVFVGVGGIEPATSYAHSLGGFGYNRLRTDYNKCRGLPIRWCFRRERGATKYGFVVRRWYPPSPPRRRGGRLDDGELRVFWVTVDDIDAAIERGRLDVPQFEELPTFDRAVAARMVQVGDDLVP